MGVIPCGASDFAAGVSVQKAEAACGKILEDPCHMLPLGSTWCRGVLRLLTPLNIIKGDTGEV